MNTTYRTKPTSMTWGLILTIVGVALTMSFVLPFIGFIMGVVGLVVLVAGIGFIATAAKERRKPVDRSGS